MKSLISSNGSIFRHIARFKKANFNLGEEHENHFSQAFNINSKVMEFSRLVLCLKANS